VWLCAAVGSTGHARRRDLWRLCEQLLDQRAEGGYVERLAQDSRCLRRTAGTHQLIERLAGDHHARDRPEAWIDLHEVGDLPTVHSRHHDVESHHVDVLGGKHLQRPTPIVCLQDAITVQFHHRGEHLADGRLIIHDQHRLDPDAVVRFVICGLALHLRLSDGPRGRAAHEWVKGSQGSAAPLLAHDEQQ
jgi:hypothetical protein